jgi:hypothetical protein
MIQLFENIENDPPRRPDTDSGREGHPARLHGIGGGKNKMEALSVDADAFAELEARWGNT